MLGLVGGAISRAIKNLTNKASKSSSSSKSSSNKSSSSSKSSSNKTSSSSKSSSNNYGSGSSYAYDPSGNKVNVSIKNGQSYLDNGQRVGAGYTVQTGGGIYKMGNDGKGYKVDSHNVYSPNNSSRNSGSRNSSSSNSGLDARSKGISLTPFTDYSNQYNDALLNIYEKNKVDNSVLRNMFTSDILNRNNTDPDYQRYGDFEITDEMISGYNNAYDENMRQLTTKYNNFDDNKKNSREGQLYLDAINRASGNTSNTNNASLNQPMYAVTQQPYVINQGINPNDFNNMMGEMGTQFGNALTSVNNNLSDAIMNMGQSFGSSLNNLANTFGGLSLATQGTNGEEIYKTGNGTYLATLNGKAIEINENEYINYMSQLTGI